MLAPNPTETTDETKFYVVVVAENTATPETAKSMVKGRPIFTAKERCGFFRGGGCAMLAPPPPPPPAGASDGVTLVGVLCATATLYSESNGSRLWSCPLIVAGPVRMRLLDDVYSAVYSCLKMNCGVCSYGRRALVWREAPPLTAEDRPDGPDKPDKPRHFKRRRTAAHQPGLASVQSEDTRYYELPLILQ